MKKILLFAAALGCAFASKAADYTLPFSFTASEETFSQCRKIDANGDQNGKNGGWTLSADDNVGNVDAFSYWYNSRNKADDWLVLPAVNFGETRTVRVSVDVHTTGYPEGFEVYLGAVESTFTDREAIAAMTIPVMSHIKYQSPSISSYTTLSADITLPSEAPSVLSLGIHAVSEADKNWLRIRTITIEEAVAVVAPAAPVVKSSTIRDLDYSAVVTMPSVDTDGQAIEGTLDLRVLVDGTLTDTKTGCTPGADVDVNLTLLAGTHTISFVAVQGSAESAAATDNIEAKEHVAVPAKPVINSCTVNFLSLSASVTAPSLDTDGNNLSGNLSLLMLVDGIEVSSKDNMQAGGAATFTRTLAAGSHTIGFIAKLNGQRSEMASTEVVAKEQVFELPFTMTASAETFALCEPLDENHDEVEGKANGIWTYQENYGAFVYTYNDNNKADDWLILPKVNLGSVRKIKVSVSVKTGSYKESFEIKLGGERTVAAMTIPVMNKEDYTHTGDPENLTATVELPADAPSVLALGIHATSARDRARLMFTEIKIESAEIPEIIPAVPIIKESSIKNLNYTAVVTMPAVDTEGNALTEAMSLEVLVDDVVVETKTDCAAGADVDVALTLAAGEHTVAYRAVLGENTGEAVSETVTATALSTGGLPFTFDATEANFGECEIIDIDGSVENYGNVQGCWQYATDGSFKYVYNPNSDADDWLILPFVDFAKCMKVKVSVDVKTENEPESFEIFLGQERTVEGMTIPVLSKTGFTSKTWTTLTAEVNTPYGVARAANRLFALGIHATSPQNHYNMYFKNFRIEALVLSGIDDVEADEDAEPEYYNLQGIRVANPTHGIYIMRRGSVVSKVVL